MKCKLSDTECEIACIVHENLVKIDGNHAEHAIDFVYMRTCVSEALLHCAGQDGDSR